MRQLGHGNRVKRHVPEDKGPFEERVVSVSPRYAPHGMAVVHPDEGRDRREEAAQGELPGGSDVVRRA